MTQDEFFKLVTDGEIAELQAAVAGGINVNAQDAYGRTALHHGAKEGNAETINALLAASAEVSAKDKEGRTPLHLANSMSAAILMKHRADFLSLDNQGNSPLHTAAESDAAFCRLIVDAGMIVDGRNNCGLTPLHFAALQGKRTVAEFLLSKGADVNAKTLADYQYKWTYVGPDVLGMERRVARGSTPLDISQAEHQRNKWVTSNHKAFSDFLVGKGALAKSKASVWRLAFLPVTLVCFPLFAWGLILLDARMRGWTRLAHRFAATRPPAGVLKRHQDGFVGRIGLLKLKSMLTAAASEEGLYLAMPSWLSAGHPPLLIPWSEMRVAYTRPGLEGQVIGLRIGEPEIGLITLRAGLADEVTKRIK